ncbi:MAG TPA: glycosyltransferase family 4 protein [Candidatus Acidoferrum sp.]|nr:glycosyltransferase family 4 protein [Candidatus Acidoferrum sp.]
MSPKELRLTFVSSYPPRECGIATFTQDLLLHIIHNDHAIKCDVYAIDPSHESHIYGCLSPLLYPRSKVHGIIKDKDPISFFEAARKLNLTNVDVVNIQHEFGLYGGIWGSNIIDFMEALDKPIVTTLHTVLSDPPKIAQSITKRIYDLSDSVVVSANIGKDILNKAYGLDSEKIAVIPHGVPDVPFISTNRPKKKLSLEKQFVLSTFGLIHPAKGVEFVLEALPKIISDNPDVDVRYLVVGETHPNIVKRSGEKYREQLKAMVKDLNLDKNVAFIDRYLTNREMIVYFLASDMCILPYLGKDQISSGVLSQAIGCGKTIISTPFLHAEEALSEGRGTLVDFKDSYDIAVNASKLIRDSSLRREMEIKTYTYGRSITWNEIAHKYTELFNTYLMRQEYTKTNLKQDKSDIDVI